ncbi:hypothetical protein [Glycomyces buryatensis]|uniref:Uncharacterized protein n=1 Tax=Glycomyces buryatensis TaxID=2570927 RepID=A0A4V4HS65_9ACTN|nr:hypothetical protein [Glycomyces buryatensis]THV40556.1 hypothetical protein FAB82_14920 [Glycomyces buryatensis]
MTTTVLGEGFLEVDLPARRRDPDAYRWDDIVTLFHRGNIYGDDVEFPADLAGQRGTLVAVVNREPRKQNEVDHAIRRGAGTPPLGSEVVLGTGTVHFRKRTMSGHASDLYENNAIGIKPRLDGDAVRSLMSQWAKRTSRTGFNLVGKLELHQ